MVKYYNGEMYIIPKKFEEETRADERKKFAMWLDTHGFMRKMDLNISRVDEALYEYGKEHKNAE